MFYIHISFVYLGANEQQRKTLALHQYSQSLRYTYKDRQKTLKLRKKRECGKKDSACDGFGINFQTYTVP